MPQLMSSRDALASASTSAVAEGTMRPSPSHPSTIDSDPSINKQIISPTMTLKTRHYHSNRRSPPQLPQRQQNQNDMSVCGSQSSSVASCSKSIVVDMNASKTVTTASTINSSSCESFKKRPPLLGLKLSLRTKKDVTQPSQRHLPLQQQQPSYHGGNDNPAEVLASAKASAAACLIQKDCNETNQQSAKPHLFSYDGSIKDKVHSDLTRTINLSSGDKSREEDVNRNSSNISKNVTTKNSKPFTSYEDKDESDKENATIVLPSTLCKQSEILASASVERQESSPSEEHTKNAIRGAAVNLPEIIRRGIFDCHSDVIKRPRSAGVCDYDDKTAPSTDFLSGTFLFQSIQCGKGISLNRFYCNHDDTDIDPKDEALLNQLHRMTSWNTIGTYDTLLSSSSYVSVSSVSASEESIEKAPAMAEESVSSIEEFCSLEGKKRKENKKKTRVRFEYPPVSSLHERPRTQPNEINKLYFTEEELDMIYDDRCSTDAMDDVEVLAFSSLSLAKEEMRKGQQDLQSASFVKKHLDETRETVEENHLDQEISDGGGMYNGSYDTLDQNDRNKDRAVTDDITKKNTTTRKCTGSGPTTSVSQNNFVSDFELSRPSDCRKIPHKPTSELNHNAHVVSYQSRGDRTEKDDLLRTGTQRRQQSNTLSSYELPAKPGKGDEIMSSRNLNNGERTSDKEKEVQIYVRQRSIPLAVSK